MGGWVGLRTGVGAVFKKEISYSFRESNKCLFVVEITA
jgi:hypothetical protein